MQEGGRWKNMFYAQKRLINENDLLIRGKRERSIFFIIIKK
jgi:hypothetical protein